MRDFDREWRRIERQEFWRNARHLTFAAIVFGTMIYGMFNHPKLTQVIASGIVAIGLPLSLWFGRRK